MNKLSPNTPLPTIITRVNKTIIGLEQKTSLINTEKKITSKMNKEYKTLLATIKSEATPITANNRLIL